MLRENNLFVGFAIGVVLPVLCYMAIDGLFDAFDTMNITTPSGGSYRFKDRTIALMAVCVNLIPFQIFNNSRKEKTMRGLLLATAIYAIGWMIIFGINLLNAE